MKKARVIIIFLCKEGSMKSSNKKKVKRITFPNVNVCCLHGHVLIMQFKTKLIYHTFFRLLKVLWLWLILDRFWNILILLIFDFQLKFWLLIIPYLHHLHFEHRKSEHPSIIRWTFNPHKMSPRTLPLVWLIA